MEKEIKVIKNFGVPSSKMKIKKDFQIVQSYHSQVAMEYFLYHMKTFVNIFQKFIFVWLKINQCIKFKAYVLMEKMEIFTCLMLINRVAMSFNFISPNKKIQFLVTITKRLLVDQQLFSQKERIMNLLMEFLSIINLILS